MQKLKIEYIKTKELKKYANNAKIHTAEQIEQIKESIREFGMNDPIAVWKDNEIIEGHGRLLACKELEIEEVPIIRLDDLTDEQRKAYMNVHNQLALNTGYDYNILDAELAKICSIDMAAFGFETPEFNVDDFGTEFSIDSADHPKIRTITLSVSEQQNAIIERAVEEIEIEEWEAEEKGEANNAGFKFYKMAKELMEHESYL